MNTLLEMLNKNTLIEGVKVANDKVFVYDPLNTKGYKEIKKFQAITIIEGLETFIYINRYTDTDYSAVEIVEGVTGAYLNHSPIGVSSKEEARQKCIEEVTKKLTTLQEKGILVKVFSQIASHFGISPRYGGNVEVSVTTPSELKVGDRIRKVNLRGGVGVYDGEITAINGNEYYKSYKFTVDDSFSTYFDLARMDRNASGYYEPEFIEILGEEAKTNVEEVAPVVEIKAETTEIPSELGFVTSVITEKEVLENTLTDRTIEEVKKPVIACVSDVSPRQFENWITNTKTSALKNLSKEIPAEAKEADVILKENGFILSCNDRLDNKRIHMVYFKPLESIKRFYRVAIDNLATDNSIETKFQIRLVGPYFKHDELLTVGNVSELEEILKGLGIENTQSNSETNVGPEVGTIVEEVIESRTEVSNDEVIKQEQIAESPYKFILDKYQGFEGWRGYYLYDVTVLEEGRELFFTYKYGEYDTTSSQIKRSYLNDDPSINDWINKNGKAFEQQIIIREHELKIASEIFDYLDNVYTLEEVIECKVNLKVVPVKTEDLSVLSNEEYASKRNGIWNWWHEQERQARKMETPDYSYSEYLTPVNDILHTESFRRDKVYTSTLSDDEIKYFATKWVYSERMQEIIGKEDKQKLLQALKGHSNSGGSLLGDYRFHIGFLNCSLKDIEIQAYSSAKDGNRRIIKMTYSEAADLLIKHFKVQEQEEAILPLVEVKSVEEIEPIQEIETHVEEITVEAVTETEPEVEEEQVTLFTVTNEDILRLQMAVKSNMKKKALIEGQMSLFAI